MKKFLKWFLSPKSDILLFVIVLILACVAGNHYYRRFDMTSQKAFSISEVSVQTVENLSEPLTVHVFFSDDLTSPYNTTYQYVKDLLAEYKRKANDNFSVVYYDMKKEENQAEAQKYGIQQIQIQDVSATKVDMKLAWMGIVLTYGDSIVPMNGITSQNGFEYNLTTRMIKLVSTQDNLAGLGEGNKIKITFYGSDKFARAVPGYNQLDEYIKKAVNDLNKKNHDCLDYSYVVPKDDEKEMLVEKYGIQRLDFSDSSFEVFGLVAEYADRFRHIYLKIDVSHGFPQILGADNISSSMEEALTGFISNNLQVGYVTGHEEAPLTDEEGRSLNLVRNTADIYEFKEINLSEKDIPSNISLLFINGPKQKYSDAELYKIDQFLMQGGNLFVLADSYDAPTQQNQYYPAKLDTGLTGLLEKYGIKVNPDRLYDENCYNATDYYGRRQKIYEAPVVTKDDVNQKSIVSKNLGYLIFVNTSTIDVSKANENGLDVTVFAKSSPKSWTLENSIQYSPDVNQPYDDRFDSYNLAVLVEGRFHSAYEKSPFETEGKDIKADDHISNAVQSGKIIVMGTSEVAKNNMYDASCSEPIAMLVRNSIDYLNGNGTLCEMRTKTSDFSGFRIDEEKDKNKMNTVRYLCQFGVPLLVAVLGIAMLLLRISRKKKVHMAFNPDDKRDSMFDDKIKSKEGE